MMIKLPFRRSRINIKAFHLRLSHKSGFGLISLLIAIGVMGLILAGVMESLQNNLKAQKKFEELSDMVELRRVLRGRIDCNQTKAANPTNRWNNCNEKLRAVDAADNPVISEMSPATTMGAYTLELGCSKSGASTILKIKMTRKKDNFVVTNDLFKKVPIVCN